MLPVAQCVLTFMLKSLSHTSFFSSLLPSIFRLPVCIFTATVFFLLIYLTTQDIRDSTCETVPVMVKEGAYITLNCSVAAYPPASYTWNLGDRIERTSTVILTASRDLHNKTFTCTAANSLGSKNCTTTHVNVLCEYHCMKG